ncbi:MAG: hypothetical protein ABIP68_06900 [Ferruginibacter sp.]
MNILLLAFLCNFLSKLIVSYEIVNLVDDYDLRYLKENHLLGFVLMIFAITFIPWFLIYLFRLRYKPIFIIGIRILISLLLIWYFFSLYSTYNPEVLLDDPNKKIFFIPVLLSAAFLPFTEMAVYKILSFLFGIEDG